MRGVHGHAPRGKSSPTHHSWKSMIQRCSNRRHIGYSSYGGRGISFDPRWSSFEYFLTDMGLRPDGHTLERVNVQRNYWRGNCIWLPAELQQQNQRTTRLISWRLKTMSIVDWSKELEIDRSTLQKRFDRGWSVEDAFTKPLRRKLKGGVRN